MSRLFQFRVANRGVVLLLVLWLLIMLGIIGLSYTGSVRMQLAGLAQRQGRQQALWAARAGVEYARATLDAIESAEITDTDPLFNDAESFADQPSGEARFSLVVPLIDESEEEPRFGLIDEGARLNVNLADEAMLQRLPGMSIDLADTLLDWRDPDSAPRPAGAEADYYLALEEPYLPADTALRSLRELVRIHGWDAIWDAAWPDPFRRFAPQPPAASVEDPVEARHLLDLLTVWSSVRQLAPDGRAALDLNTATADEMRGRVTGLSEAEAGAIVSHRGAKRFASPIELMDVTGSAQADAAAGGGSGRTNAQGGGRRGRGRGGQPDAGNASGGQNGQNAPNRVFSLRRAGELIDWFRAPAQPAEGAAAQPAVADAPSPEAPGLININTAPRDVLLALPDMTETLADTVLDRRAREGAFRRTGELAELGGISEDLFKKWYPLVSARSDRYRVIAEGVDPATNARARIEAVLALADDGIRIVYWREE